MASDFNKNKLRRDDSVASRLFSEKMPTLFYINRSFLAILTILSIFNLLY